VARGYVMCGYMDDTGSVWKLPVNGDYALDSSRGWVGPAPTATPPVPRLWRPRYVVGIDDQGRRVNARVATLAAPLWTGAATAFYVISNDGVAHTATVIRHVGERRR